MSMAPPEAGSTVKEVVLLIQKKKRKLLYLTIPGLLLVILFVFVPLLNGMRVAFYSWNGYGKNMKFIGLQNFISLFSDPRIGRTTVNTLIYGIGSCLLQNVFGLLAALFVQKKFFGRNTVRAIIYMPIMISGFIFGQIMRYMFALENGVMNDILALLGMEPVYWLGNSWIGVVIITLINSWQYVGLCMLIYLAGLQAIPVSYLEAARIDGAGSIAMFFKVKLPLLIPSITTCVITNLINGLKLYEIIVGMTGGGPNRETMSLAQYIQVLYFDDERAGYAAAMGIFMFVLIMILALPLNSWLKKQEVSG